VFSLTIFFLFFYALSILTYGVAVPSGLFVPCILCGASYGRLVGMFMTELSGGQDIDEGTYALLGAASFLGGAMRMTVSLCVILLELTNNLNLLPLIMLVLLVSKAVGDCTGIQPVYEIHIDLKRLPFLGAKAPHFMRHVKAAEAATPNPVSLQVRPDMIINPSLPPLNLEFPCFPVSLNDHPTRFEAAGRTT
jgi:chloride channel 7